MFFSGHSDLYYVAFPGDKLFIQCLVYVVYILETVQTAIMTHDGYVAYGLKFGDVDSLMKARLAWFSVPVITAVGE